GGMAAYGLGFFDSKASTHAPVATTVPEPVKPTPAPQPVRKANPAPAPTPVPRVLDITLETVPAGAAVEIGGKVVGKTPIYLTMREGGETRTVVFKADGHRDITVLLDPTSIVLSGKKVHRYFLEKVPAATKKPVVEKHRAGKPKEARVRPKAKKTVQAKKTKVKKTKVKKTKVKKTRVKKAKARPVLNWD
ncbi:MAG: PEGA domain-containing protein, partial [Deltaproteobacteria bacterium]|nr:PEGA domain-containing protein [Deltaproteobacteria bacterium]